jgi:Ca-activated chloride channel family protein
LWVFLLTAAASASPSSALREYKAGKYDQALREYDQLLKRHSDDPRLHFNAGAAAYKNQEFEAAVKQFNEALAAPDLKLQALAYYNQGNSLYHLGERAPDPAKRSESWEKSLQDYDSAMKLNPQDADAKFNYEFVKKRLEELKQQQQQQQQNKSDQKKNQDQQQQQQNQQSQDQKKDQDQKSQAQQNQSEQKDQPAQQQKAEEEKKQQEQQAAKQSQEQKDQQQAAQAKEKPDEKGQGEPAKAYAAGQMTPQEAQQLLDAQKGEEMMLPVKPTGKPMDRNRPFKDW